MNAPPGSAAVAPARVGAVAALALLAAVLLAYVNALAAPFQFDDWWLVAGNPATAGLGEWWASLPGIRPLLKLSFALNARFAPAPWAYHAVNIAVHAGNVLLVFALSRRLLPVLAPRHAHPGLAAFGAALLFALHPAATEAVTYVSGRSIALMALPCLAALWLLLRQPRPGPRTELAVAGLFALALAVRETAVTLPAAAALLLWQRGDPPRQIARALRGMALVLAGAALAAWLTPGYHSFFGWSLQARDLGAQLLGQLEAHAYLVSHPLLTLRTNIDPELSVPAAPALRHALFAALALALAVFAWRQRRARPWLLFALAWYVLQLLPSNSLLPRFDLANDRHLYLSLWGPALAAAIVLAGIRRPAPAMLATAALALVLGVATVRRNHDYRSELALWTATVQASPGKARPWTNLGFARQQRGDLDGARAAYACAHRLDPAYRQAAWNLAALGDGPVDGDCPRQ